MGEVGRRADFVFSGTSIQGTPSGPRDIVFPEQIRGVT